MNKLKDLLMEYKTSIQREDNVKEIGAIKNTYMEHAYVKGLYEELKNADNFKKGQIIAEIKLFKEELGNILKNRTEEIKSKEVMVDTSLPVYNTIGSIHPMSITINSIKTIIQNFRFENMVFEFRETSEIETGFNNFDALNIPPLHPCRTDHQSFHIDEERILRTQTTSTTARILQENKNHNGAYFTVGKTYRKDSDATHVPMFNQWEVLVIHERANFTELLTFVKTFLNTFFQSELKYRFRPSFFPFTRFSTEVDIWFNGRWLEVLGCGIIAPEVFEACNSINRMAFAIGGGVERLCMIKNNIKDIRSLYGNKKILGFTNFGGKI